MVSVQARLVVAIAADVVKARLLGGRFFFIRLFTGQCLTEVHFLALHTLLIARFGGSGLGVFVLLLMVLNRQLTFAGDFQLYWMREKQSLQGV